jgi:hypothetical protein
VRSSNLGKKERLDVANVRGNYRPSRKRKTTFTYMQHGK